MPLLKRGVRDLYWTVRGQRISMPAMPSVPRSVLLVCIVNIFQNPFAEHLGVKLRQAGVISGLKFGSAGLHVSKPIPFPDDAIRVAKRYGVCLENHRSQSISPELVASYDRVIAMEARQYAALQSSFLHHREKLFLLPLLDSHGQAEQYGYAAFNIQDPYGGPLSDFDVCFERISKCIKAALRPAAQ